MKSSVAKRILNKGKEDFNEIAEKFAQTRRKVQPEILFLKDYIKEGDKVLDIGCGSGRFYDFFQEKKVDYFGIDFSKKLIDIAKRKYLPHSLEEEKFSDKPLPTFIKVDALDLPFEDNFFDKIFSIAVFHHIPSKEKRIDFLREMKRVLRRGGEVHLTVWNLWTKRYFFKIIKANIKKFFFRNELDYCDIFIPFDKRINRYYHCFCKGELKKLFLEAGFKVKEVRNLRRNKKLLNFYIRAQK